MLYETKLISNFTLCFVLIVVLYSTTHGQTNEHIKSLQQKIQLADSVVLISHELTAEYGIKIVPYWDKRDVSMNLKKWNKLHPPLLKYLYKGKLNRKIIKESLALTTSNKISLSNILFRQVLLKSFNPSNCDEPRHSIMIYKDNKESYIDICFGCRRINTSKDIDFSEFYIDEKKWNDLEDFFKINGLTKLFIQHND
jgi:hypothetical protein